jgi:hypothetical protein
MAYGKMVPNLHEPAADRYRKDTQDREEELDDMWQDLGEELRRMGKDEPGW